MADNSVSSWAYNYGRNRENPNTDLNASIQELIGTIKGDETGTLGSSKPSRIARKFIQESYGAKAQTREALPDVFQSYLNQINRGALSPEEAGFSYLDLVRSTGGNLKEGIAKSDVLSSTKTGFAPTETYERYKPAASLAFEQLLGRSINEDEFKNYVSAAQGLGISKGPDFQAFLGKSLMSSPEYRSKAVIFDPGKVGRASKEFAAAYA